MTKRRSIISYDKLTIEQKKQILREFPDGYVNHLTTIKTPNGEVLDALIWETEEIIYLVKINKMVIRRPADDDEDDEDDDFDEVDAVDDADDDIDDDDDDDKPKKKAKRNTSDDDDSDDDDDDDDEDE